MYVEEIKQRVIALIEQFDWMFSTNNFDRHLKWCDKDEGEKIAEIEFFEDYQLMNIRVYPLFSTLTPEEQRKALLHEYCHTITLPSKQALDNFLHGKITTEDRNTEINETATSKIENLLDKLLQGNLTYAREAYKKYSMPNKKPTKAGLKYSSLGLKKKTVNRPMKGKKMC